MKEEFLHHIWKHRLFTSHTIFDKEGKNIEIIDVGYHNHDAGPDFVNAKIKIGDTLWAGNVEIHIKSSDWNAHKHAENTAYNSVILHVVTENNADVFTSDGRKIPQIQLLFPKSLSEQWEKLATSTNKVSCSEQIHSVPNMLKISWLESLVIERLETKANRIEDLLEQNKNNWEETFYITLARSFGFGINNDPFEWLAKSLPLAYLGKHKDNILQIEALLLGQSGLLQLSDATDAYTVQLKKEYAFLQQKFSLTPIDGILFKMLRLRPANFPHIRLAQFAQLIHQSSKLFSHIVENPDYMTVKKLFSVSTSSYWETHYTFGESSAKRTKKLGEKAIDIILINTVVPILFAYAKRKNLEDLQEKAVHLLESCAAENNSIVRNWQEMGFQSDSAYNTQALIQLQRNYCDVKKCLYCRFGHKLLQLSLQP
ncbi:MAG: DUF2851 family protein [Paludibacteraceae bacterium]|nr:DUF2851 family protein [Paludibacteraceae bacterium]